jgi:DNA excision repair protein ERCC-2
MAAQRLRISVRQLVEFVLQEGDLQTAFSGRNRAVEGTIGHQRVQQSRPDDYRAEVSISHRVEHDGLTLDIVGRIDGLFPQERPVVLEEIKTTTLPLKYVSADYNPLHWAQAKCYAYFYAVQHDLSEIAIQLTYYQIESRQSQSFRQLFQRAELADFFEELLTIYVAWAKTVQAWLARRDQSIQALDFPYEGYRAGQRELAVAVYQTIRNKKKLFAQAPTGIGKTIATLFPAVKAIGAGLVARIFYLTAKTPGRLVAEKTLDDMRQAGLRLKSVTLTAKDKICFCPASARSGESCDYAKNYYGKLRPALVEAYEQEALTRPVIEALAEKHQLCPFEFSLDLALWVDCIVCDYNYVFDPRVYLRRFFDNVSEPYIFLVDEAHNFPDRAREMFSAELDRETVLALAQAVKGRLPEVALALHQINQALAEKYQLAGPTALVEVDLPNPLLKALRRFISEAEVWLRLNQPADFRAALLDFYFAASAYLRTGEQFDSTYVSYFERQGNSGLRAKLFCLDPAPQLTVALARSRATIFFSATLWPLDYFRQFVTGSAKQPAMVLASPFPPENLGLVIHNRISTKYKDRDASYHQVAATIRAACAVQPGNYLVFFPSYRYLEAVVAIIQSQAPDLNLLIQDRGMGEAEREAFLAQFAAGNDQTLLGFAVMGGIFGEGIDLVGERLIGAIIVGVGLPQLGLERDLIKAYFQSQYRQGFEYAYQYPGLNRVMQAAGRVIRTETDRGVIILIDERFTHSRYTRLFPQEWRHFQTVQSEAGVAQVLGRFWGEGYGSQ